MIGLYFVIAVVVLFFIYNFIKSLSDPAVKEASDLRMSINHYRIYKKIFDEQMECHKNGITPPNRTNEIPNMNEWRRYGEYQLLKSRKSMEDSLNNL
ncbi:hypothetical protein [Parabacteroides provencensis]|uniref:hypothetical protein n=1 Tax=Parabacteroides provencensis TaxID=1944636 RepID=UPI000C146ACF|nr:hypothetical protein [Parabacteroides provencensis]